jgi:phosphomethylpyrimidine synthase
LYHLRGSTLSDNNKVINIKGRTGILTKPMPSSEKAYATGCRDDTRMPLCKINLTDTSNRDASLPSVPNEPIFIYDTADMYTDPTVTIDLEKGLPAICQA